ncbi:MAG: hypothetical protein K0R65_1919 [Crocinitomicaceae bacterium]|jgi:hypothetical protein|nr:hypothetical protein [Crocinitomicaceae bacterium]
MNKEIAKLANLAKESARIAIRESKVLGLTITSVKGGFLVRQHADGTIEKLEPVARKNRFIGNQKIKKGLVIHAKKEA